MSATETNSCIYKKVKNGWTARQVKVVLLLGLANFASALCFSVLTPFFPTLQASKRVASQTEVGLILGVFELAGMLTAPFFGKQLTRVGAKFMLVSGTGTLGAACVVFGWVVYANKGIEFFLLCMIVRSFEGIASSALCTASFAILAAEFPGKVSTVVGAMETCSGLGYIAGPPLGGLLFMAGGFEMPFIIVGCITALLALICYFCMPIEPEDDALTITRSYWKLMTLPEILIPTVTMVLATASLSFIDLTLSEHLEQLNLSPMMVVVTFLISTSGYAFIAPLWGMLVDGKHCAKSVMMYGSIICAISFFIVGPSPLLSVGPSTVLVTIALAMLGMGISAQIIPPYEDALNLAIQNGYPTNLDTFGLISGLTNAAYSMGSFLGSVVGGLAMDDMKFYWSTTYLSFAHALLSVALASYIIVRRYLAKCKSTSYSIL